VKKWLLLTVLALAARPAAAACTVSGGGISFGSYDGSAAVGGTGSVSFNCGLLTSFTIKLGPGSGTIGQRTMTINGGGSATLNYNLYQDVGHATLWGDGTTGQTQFVLSILGGFSLPVFGLIPAGQRVTAGGYGDNVVITIVF
jgi:spore coat protein U-like protein